MFSVLCWILIYAGSYSMLFYLRLQFSSKDETKVCEIIKDGILVFNCLRLIRAVVVGRWFIEELNLTKSLEKYKKGMIYRREGRLCHCEICKLNWKLCDGSMSLLFTLFKFTHTHHAWYLIIPSKYLIDEGKSGRNFIIFEGGGN